MLCVPQEAQGEVRVPVAGASSNYAVEKIWVILSQSHSLSTSGGAALVERMLGLSAIICCYQCFGSWCEQADGIVDPGGDLLFIVQVG